MDLRTVDSFLRYNCLPIQRTMPPWLVKCSGARVRAHDQENIGGGGAIPLTWLTTLYDFLVYFGVR